MATGNDIVSIAFNWVCGRVGITLGSWPYTVTQWNACKRAGTTMSIESAIATPGALLFNHRTPEGVPVDPPDGLLPANYHAHVAISRGNGSTIEAMSPAAGVGIGNARALTRWTAAARIPGVSYGNESTPAPPPSNVRLSAIPAFPGEAFPGADAGVVRTWQGGLITCNVISDTQANRDGVFGDGMAKAITGMQAGFGWHNPDGRGGPHTWTHMHARRSPPCPRCGS
jgi:hypothetical protein